MKNYAKQFFVVIAILLISASSPQAQTSNMGFSFQGYAVDTDGKAISGSGITVRFTIDSTPEFIEEHPLTTDAFGVFTAIVGNSSAANNKEFAKIDFTKKSTIYSLKVEVKKTVGGTYTTISNSQMKAVPYARYAFNGVPVGTIIAYGGATDKIPEGWILCDGSLVEQTDYPQLYAVIGDAWGVTGSEFNLPDLRGRFLRGVDAGAGNDPDAATRTAFNTGGNDGDDVGTYQGGEVQSHDHEVTDPKHTHTDGNFNAIMEVVTPTFLRNSTHAELAPISSLTGGSKTMPSSATGISINVSGGDETRPVNVAVHYIIKY